MWAGPESSGGVSGLLGRRGRGVVGRTVGPRVFWGRGWAGLSTSCWAGVVQKGPGYSCGLHGKPLV